MCRMLSFTDLDLHVVDRWVVAVDRGCYIWGVITGRWLLSMYILYASLVSPSG